MAAMWVFMLLLLSRQSKGRDLRPSEHGLESQTSPAEAEESPAMMKFFGGKHTTTPSVPLPIATNSSELPPLWLSHRGGTGSSDRLKTGMLAATLVCGITGLALLLATASVFIHKLRNRRSASPSPPPPPSPSTSTVSIEKQ